MDYKKEYDEYWSRSDRWGSHSFDKPDLLADEILSVCPASKVLDVGFGMGLLVRTLLRKGIDAHGIDIAQRPVDEANKTLPGRFSVGSILNIPFPENSFDTVVSTDCLEHISEEDVPKALSELCRVTKRFVYVRLATTPDRDRRWHLTIRDRAWWENKFFDAGLRKNPLTQEILSYESLEKDEWQITLLFEKIPPAAFEKFPPATLKAERDLHMDMLRETGRRSDAHVVRYVLARNLLPKNGVVVDAACGLGYGSALLAQSEPSNRVVGIDFSEFAVDYAKANFTVYTPNAEFHQGDACDLSRFADASVDLVVSFETVEHLKQPEVFLKEVKRVLKPGGRFIGSVPDKWVDESGKDPNPWHFHVFDCRKFVKLCEPFFRVERIYGQTAGGGMKLTNAPRHIAEFQQPLEGHEDTEWCLIVGVATEDPLDVIVLSHENEKKNPLYTSWVTKMKRPVKWITQCGPDWEPPASTGLIVTHDHYNEPWVSILRRAVEKNIPTLVLADGILEFRNTFEHPDLVSGSIYQPVLGHKLACIGRSQARVVESWGNVGICEVVGQPRFDEVQRPSSPRARKDGEPFRLLVMTAKTPSFTPEQREKVLRSLTDLKQHLSERISRGEPIQVLWRLTGDLAQELKVPNTLGNLNGELGKLLRNMDAVITTPSTAMLEAMLLKLPTAILDYTNSPQFVPAAWTISAPEHIGSVIDQLTTPPASKLLFQETVLQDALHVGSAATPRLIQLIERMIELGRDQRSSKQSLKFPVRILDDISANTSFPAGEIQLDKIFSEEPVFTDRDTAALQVEVAHLRKALGISSARGSANSSRVLFVSTNDCAFGGSEELWSQAALKARSWGRIVGVSVRNWESGEGRLDALRDSGCEMFARSVPATSEDFAGALDFKPDLVVLSQGYNLEGLEWMELLADKGIPFVNVIQCVHETGWPAAKDDFISRLATAYGKSKRICFVSEQNRALHEKMLGTKFKASVIVRNPYAVPRDAAQEWPDESTFHVALVGRLESYHKGQDLLLEVLRQEKWQKRDVQFHLYGRGPHENLLRRLISEWEIPNCSLEGHAEDISAIWRKNHACIQPSRFEGLPLTIVEAALSGRMIIATDVGGNSEIVVNGKTGFLAASPTVKDLDAALEEAWNRRKEWRSLGMAACDHAISLIPEEPVIDFLNSVEPFIAKFPTVARSASAIVSKESVWAPVIYPVQLFYNVRGEFNEQESITLPCPEGQWQQLSFVPCKGHLRLDPTQGPGLVEIAEISVRSACNGKAVWEASSAAEWDSIIVGGDGVRIGDERFLKIFCHGNDPRLLLPEIKLPETDEPLNVILIIRISASFGSNASSPDSLLKTLKS